MNGAREGLFVLATLASLLPGQEKRVAEPGVQAIAHPKELVRIEVPATWKIENLRFQDLNSLHKAHDLISFVVPAAAGGILDFYLTVIFPTSVRPLAQAWYESSAPEALAIAERVGVYKDPVPHAIWIDAKRPQEYRVLAFRREQTRGLHLLMYCRKEQWPGLKDVFFKIAQSATVKFDPWLPRLEARKLTMHRDIGYSAAEDVTSAELKDVQKTVESIRGRFEKVHGPRWQSTTEPLAIYINGTRSAHASFDGATDRQFDVMGSAIENRVLTIPLGAGASRVRAHFADRIVGIFLRQTYGVTAEWMVRAEEVIETMVTTTGKSMPTVSHEFFRGIVPTAMTLDRVLQSTGLVPEARDSHLVAYVALFRTGAAPYRKAYQAFLAELRETCDGETALKKHLLSMDQEKMRAAAAVITKRMKPAKKRRE